MLKSRCQQIWCLVRTYFQVHRRLSLTSLGWKDFSQLHAQKGAALSCSLPGKLHQRSGPILPPGGVTRDKVLTSRSLRFPFIKESNSLAWTGWRPPRTPRGPMGRAQEINRTSSTRKATEEDKAMRQRFTLPACIGASLTPSNVRQKPQDQAENKGSDMGGEEKKKKKKSRENGLLGAIVPDESNIQRNEVARLEGRTAALKGAIIMPVTFPQLLTGCCSPLGHPPSLPRDILPGQSRSQRFHLLHVLLRTCRQSCWGPRN